MAKAKRSDQPSNGKPPKGASDGSKRRVGDPGPADPEHIKSLKPRDRKILDRWWPGWDTDPTDGPL